MIPKVNKLIYLLILPFFFFFFGFFGTSQILVGKFDHHVLPVSEMAGAQPKSSSKLATKGNTWELIIDGFDRHQNVHHPWF